MARHSDTTSRHNAPAAGSNRTVRLARSLLGALFFFAYGLGGLLIGGLLLPFFLMARARTRRRVIQTAYRLFIAAARLTRLFDVRLSPEDRHRLAHLRGRVIVANHITLIDVIILMALLPDATALAKSAASRNFFYAWIVRGVFLINDDPAGLRQDAARLLADGVNVIIFPEGTRTPADAPARKLHRGAAQIALHARAPLQPVFLTCTPPVLGKHQPWYQLADRPIVWHVAVKPELPLPPPSSDAVLRREAVTLTDTISHTLWS